MASFLLDLLIILFVIFNVESITIPIGTKQFNLTKPRHLLDATNDWKISYIPDIEIEFDIIFHTLSTHIDQIFLIGDNSNHAKHTEFPRMRISLSLIIINWDNPSPLTGNISNIEKNLTGFPSLIDKSNHIYFRGTPSSIYFELNGIALITTSFVPFNIPTSSLSDIWPISMGNANATISNFNIYAVNSCRFQCSQCNLQICSSNGPNCSAHETGICVPNINIKPIQCGSTINGTYNFEPLIFELDAIRPMNVVFTGCNPDFNAAITLITSQENKPSNDCIVTTNILDGMTYIRLDVNDTQSFNRNEEIAYNLQVICLNLTTTTKEPNPCESCWNILWIILDILLLIILILILIRINKQCKKRRVHQEVQQVTTICTDDDVLTQSEVIKPCKVNVNDDSDEDEEQNSELQQFMDEPVEINEDDY